MRYPASKLSLQHNGQWTEWAIRRRHKYTGSIQGSQDLRADFWLSHAYTQVLQKGAQILRSQGAEKNPRLSLVNNNGDEVGGVDGEQDAEDPADDPGGPPGCGKCGHARPVPLWGEGHMCTDG